MLAAPPTRLNKFIALASGVSRREADDLISAGRVSVDGSIAELGARVHHGQVVCVDGEPLTSIEYMYLAFHKPVGYVCSRRAQGDTPTIYSIIPEKYHHLKPVGRLDKDTSGILLLTNDGDFAHQMTHPSFHKQKSYEVTLDHALAPLHRQMISDFGVMLDDGKSKFGLERQKDGDDTSWRITMHEGRNRQIRRTFAALGYEVKTLHRAKFGNHSLEKIKSSGDYTQFEMN